MRTTLNLDDDVAALLSRAARQRGSSLSQTANDVLRAGFLAVGLWPTLEPYEPRVFDSGRVLMGVTDVSDVQAVLDEFDADG
jgi:hypothetical protein